MGPLTSLAIITDTDSTTSDAVFAIVIVFTSAIAACSHTPGEGIH
jgi:hypothetical protein